MCVINSWLLYRRSLDKINFMRYQENSLSAFKLRLSTSLILNGKNPIKKRGRPSSFSVNQEYFRKKHCGHATKPLPEQDVRKMALVIYQKWPTKGVLASFQDVKEKSSCSVLNVKSICAVKRIVNVLLDFILNKLFL